MYYIFSFLHLQETLNISIYYEPLNTASMNFMRNQLAPNFNNISQTVNIDFVPFGRATVSISMCVLDIEQI